MPLETLDEFLGKGNRWPSNAYVKEPGFKQLYVRIARRYVNGKVYPAIDLANIEAEEPGQGAFTKLVARLMADYPTMGIFVESVLNERFRTKLQDLGFRFVGRGPLEQNYFMFPPAELHGPINISRLARIHLRRYASYLEFARQHPEQKKVNIEQTTHFLNIWKSIEAKNFRWEDLSEEEKFEITDAIEDEHS